MIYLNIDIDNEALKYVRIYRIGSKYGQFVWNATPYTMNVFLHRCNGEDISTSPYILMGFYEGLFKIYTTRTIGAIVYPHIFSAYSFQFILSRFSFKGWRLFLPVSYFWHTPLTNCLNYYYIKNPITFILSRINF